MLGRYRHGESQMSEENNTILQVENLKKHFPIKRGIIQRQVGAIKAVDGIS